MKHCNSLWHEKNISTPNYYFSGMCGNIGFSCCQELLLFSSKSDNDFHKGSSNEWFLTFCNTLLTCISALIFYKAIRFWNTFYYSWCQKLKVIVEARHFQSYEIYSKNKDNRSISPSHHSWVFSKFKAVLGVLNFPTTIWEEKKKSLVCTWVKVSKSEFSTVQLNLLINLF